MCKTVSQDDIDKAVKMHYNKHTVAAYRSAMKHLLGKRMCLDEIQNVVASWGDLAASTIYQRRAAVNWLIAMMGSGAEKGLADNLKYPKGKPGKPRGSLSDDQVKSVLAAINTTRERLLITVLLHTGLRIGSVTNLTFESANVRFI